MKKSIFHKVVYGGLIMAMLSNPVLAKDLTIRVSEVDVERPGNVMVMLYAKDGYPKDHEKAVSVQVKSADQADLDFIFAIDIEEFAIKVFHDENMDGKVSKNWTGVIPSEGLGFSNGAKLNFGPPSFKESKLNLSEIEGDIEIPIIYP